jgi:hypothetical protein
MLPKALNFNTSRRLMGLMDVTSVKGGGIEIQADLNRNFHFPFRQQQNIPPSASVCNRLCICFQPKAPSMPGWAIAGTKKP